MLIKCTECGKEISDKADKCPNCGCPSSEWKKEENKDIEESEKSKYWCRGCYRQNKIGIDYCEFCGKRLTPYYELEKTCINDPKKEESMADENEKFEGVYRSTLFKGLEKVCCPRCNSENCSHYQEQKIIPGKTKTRYTANLNPLKPLTLVNKKEKVVRKEEVITEKKFLCNKCGNIFN